VKVGGILPSPREDNKKKWRVCRKLAERMYRFHKKRDDLERCNEIA